jgi:hypothetical protein
MCFPIDARTVAHVHRFEVMPGGTPTPWYIVEQPSRREVHDPTKRRAGCHLAALQCERQQKAHILRRQGACPKANPKDRRATPAAERLSRVQDLDSYFYL